MARLISRACLRSNSLTEVVAAFVAWLGVSLIVLADGRRGLAVGMGLATVGLSFLAWQTAGFIEAMAILVGGSVATAERLRAGRAGWDIMPAGSTPRLILCVAAALLAWWIAASVTTGPGAPLRFAALTAIGLAGARILSSDDPAALITAISALSIAVAVAAAIEASSPGIAVYAAAGLLAAGAALVPMRSANAG